MLPPAPKLRDRARAELASLRSDWRRRTRRERAALVLLVLVGGVVLAPGLAAAFGPPPIVGFSTQGGFAILSYEGIFQANPISPGSLVFGDQVYVQFLDAQANRTVTLTVVQNVSGQFTYANATFPVVFDQVVTYQFNLPSTPDVGDVRLCIDGGCESFQHQTPLTLIPSGVLNVGGLDLLIFGVGLEMFILVIAFTALASALAPRTLWAPKGTLEVVLLFPHILLGFVLLAVLDYQAFDDLFKGTEFLFFPVVFALVYFVWVLHKFNQADPALVLRPDPQGGHRLAFNGWAIWVGERADGSKVLIGTRWRDWWSRLLGHYSVLVPTGADSTKTGAAAEQPLTNYKARTVGEEWRRFRLRPGRESPLDDFHVKGERDKGHTLKGWVKPRFIYWVESDAWLEIAQPRLSFHRTVDVPARYRDGLLVKEATTKVVLSWPHYIDPPAGMRLAGIHYHDVPVAALGWIRAERAYRRVNDLRLRANVASVTKYVAADEMAERQLGMVFRLFDRARYEPDEQELAEEARAEAPAREPGPPKPTATEPAKPKPAVGGTERRP